MARPDQVGGGVAILIHKDIEYNQISSTSFSGGQLEYSRVPIYTCSVCTIPLLHERPDQKYEILNIFNLHDTDRFTQAERKITHQIRGVFFWGGEGGRCLAGV